MIILTKTLPVLNKKGADFLVEKLFMLYMTLLGQKKNIF